MSSPPKPLHARTPLTYSPTLSARAGCNVFLKLENAQPSGSFKLRGIGHLAQRSVATYGARTVLVCSSGGNAGLACAYSAWSLGVRCTIFVPVTTKAFIVARLRGFGCDVFEGGRHWAEADAKAREYVASTEGAVYVPPFDSPVVVEGHASLVHELKEDLQEHGVSDLAAVVCSVGGGGLISGILRGLEEVGLHAPVLACETRGAASFALSLNHAHKTSPPSAALQKLDGITSIAATLGAVCVSQESLDRALAHEARGGIVSVVMEDERCVEAIRAFADDHAYLVEPACAAALAPVYAPSILRAAIPSTAFLKPGTAPPKSAPAVVVVVCGGNAMSLDTLKLWEADFAGKPAGPVRVARAGADEVVV